MTEVDISEKKENQIKIPCEIQIRSIAEELWATLSHRDIYKDIELPEKLRQKMYELSNLLDGADSFAEILMELVEDEKEKGELPSAFDVSKILSELILDSNFLRAVIKGFLTQTAIESLELEEKEKRKKGKRKNKK